MTQFMDQRLTEIRTAASRLDATAQAQRAIRGRGLSLETSLCFVRIRSTFPKRARRRLGRRDLSHRRRRSATPLTHAGASVVVGFGGSSADQPRATRPIGIEHGNKPRVPAGARGRRLLKAVATHHCRSRTRRRRHRASASPMAAQGRSDLFQAGVLHRLPQCRRGSRCGRRHRVYGWQDVYHRSHRDDCGIGTDCTRTSRPTRSRMDASAAIAM